MVRVQRTSATHPFFASGVDPGTPRSSSPSPCSSALSISTMRCSSTESESGMTRMSTAPRCLASGTHLWRARVDCGPRSLVPRTFCSAAQPCQSCQRSSGSRAGGSAPSTGTGAAAAGALVGAAEGAELAGASSEAMLALALGCASLRRDVEGLRSVDVEGDTGE